jgi:hypothetical protein
MKTDNGKRGASGVVISLVDVAPGKLRIVLDDVKNESESECGPWSHHVLYTFKDYRADDITNQKLSDKELAEFGFAVLVRIGAHHEHPIE